MGRACGTYGGEERCRPGLGEKPERRRPMGRPDCKWRIILRRIVDKCDGRTWIGLI